MLRVLGRGLFSLLSPSTCAGCELVLDEDEPARAFCGGCATLVEPAPATLLPPASHAAAFLYAGPLADAIRKLKYAGDTTAAPKLGRMLAEAAHPYSARFDAIAPVPQHPVKLRARGYNQTTLLARPLARALGVPLELGLLRRIRYVRDQASLPRGERLTNVIGAFAARRAPARRVLLVDDVRTTGATLSEAAGVLTAEGHCVTTLALAWAES